jgi:AraC family transcriptional regulator of arabinose operon
MDGLGEDMDNLRQMKNDIPPLSGEVTQAVYCHLESRVRRSGELRVACAGREHCRSDYHIQRSGYVCFGLELVIQGQGELRMRGETIRLLPGHVFLYGPGIGHDIRSDPDAPMIKYFVDFFGGSAGTLFAGKVLAPGDVRLVHELEPMMRLFDELLREGKKPSPLRAEVCALYTRLLLLKTAEAGPALASPHLQSLVNFNRCKTYIDENAERLPSLRAVAGAVHLDPRYICRLFQRYHYLSPHRYIVSRRMSRAAELLVTTDLPVKSVAARTGYEDALHFSRVFARHFRCAPREFRKAGVGRNPPQS